MPVYGVQGHPEMDSKETIGEQLIVNFIKITKNTIKQ